MTIWRTAVAVTAVVVGPTYLLFAQPAPNQQRPIGILLAAGDVSWCDETTPLKTAKIIKKELAAARSAEPEIPIRVLALGDLAYPKGRKEDFKCFRKAWGDFYDVLLPVPGNHEYDGGKRDGKDYFDQFADNPLVKQNGAMTGYYVLDFPDATKGPWRLFGLNAYAGGDSTKFPKEHAKAMAAQLAWLEKKVDPAVDANNKNCVLAFWHPPLLSSGPHGHADSTAPEAPVALVTRMQQAVAILYKHHASVVLAGHEHLFEQFTPYDENGNAAADGLRAFVVGTGGAGLYNDVNYTHKAGNSETYNQDTHGVLKIELYDNSYRWTFLPIEGQKKFDLGTTRADCNKRKP
jgi:hypothetical protein